MSPPLCIAVTPWRDHGPGPAPLLTDQAERAEALGFHSFWLPENHFAGAAAIPAPLLNHAAVAARTSRIRIGTTSYLLPVRHPLQVAEEVAVLDRLSGGRVILGVGRGFRRALFCAFGVPPGEKRERFEASLALMRSAWRGEPVAWVEDDAATGGKAPVYLAPRPVQRPHPPVWVAAFGPKALEQAGRLGLPYLASPLEPLAALEANHARHRAGAAGRPDVVPVMRTVFISTRRVDLRRARASLERRSARAGRARSVPVGRPGGIDDWALVGDPDEVAAGIARYRQRIGMTHLIAAHLRIPEVGTEAVEASVEHLARLAG